jgi:hypothetical protein
LLTFAVLHICAALHPYTSARITTVKKKRRESDARTSLVSRTRHPRDGWRCPG